MNLEANPDCLDFKNLKKSLEINIPIELFLLLFIYGVLLLICGVLIYYFWRKITSLFYILDTIEAHVQMLPKVENPELIEEKEHFEKTIELICQDSLVRTQIVSEVWKTP